LGNDYKLLIIGLDGLDYNLTLRWGFRGLLQSFHGRFHVGDISILYTPLIWSSILCGFNVEERGYDYERAVERSMGFLGLLRGFKRRIFGEKRFFRLRRLLFKLGLVKSVFIMPENLLKDTFLEVVRSRGFRVFVVEVPGYNERVNGLFRIRMHELVLSEKLSDKLSFIEDVKRDAINRLERTRDALNNYDLVMCYLPLPDLAHHLFFRGVKSKVRMHGVYSWLEVKVNEYLLREAYKLGFNVLILSDHGFDMKRYTHSEYAFWSCNVNLPGGIESYRDVKDCVLKLMGVLK